MLPRKGFFKNIQCPFNKANLCHRPFCHYKHAASGYTEEKKTTVNSTYFYDSQSSSNLVNSDDLSYSASDSVPENFGYKPTHISKSKPVSILKTNTIPEYKPTPISKLRELNNSHGQYDVGSFSSANPAPVGKKKHIEEYDPTEIKCAPKLFPKKSVSFAVEETVQPTFSSDDDLDDSTSNAKFSDDEFDCNIDTLPLHSSNASEVIKPAKVIETPEEKESESDLDEKKVDEFSLVDKILIETKRNEKLLSFAQKEVAQTKPVLQEPKIPLILKGAKINSAKTKNISNDDIYNPDDSQSSIPDYSSFNTLNTTVEIDTLIKKYDKKTFNTDVSSYDSPKQVDSDINNSESNSNDKSYQNEDSIPKESDENNKDLQKTEKSDKKISSAKEKKKKHSKSETKDRKSESSKKRDDKTKDSSKSSKKVSDSLDRTSEKHKSSSSKSKTKDSSKITDEIVKHSSKHGNDKVKKSDKKLDAKSHKTISKTENFSTKHKSKSKTKYRESHSKKETVCDISSSSDVELQDGKVSSSCIEKNNKSGGSSKHSKLGDSSVKHDFSSSNHSKKPFKRKKDTSDSESNSEKDVPKKKQSFKIPKLDNAISSIDESAEENVHSSKTYSKKKSIKSNEVIDSSTDDGSDCSYVKRLKSQTAKSLESLTLKQRAIEDIEISSDSDNDLNEECWQIYNEVYSDENVDADKEESVKETSSNVREVNTSGKKRLAHAAAADIKKPKMFVGKLSRPISNPGQVMHNRYAQLMKAKEEKAQSNLPAKPSGRIAVSPNNSLLAAITEKKKQAQASISDFTPLPTTVAKTLKAGKRVAHVPDLISKPRPIIPADYGSKVPTIIRQKFLNAFIDEYLKSISVEEEAYEEALEEEKKAFQRSSSKAIYMNVASNTLARLRQKTNEQTELNKVSSTSKSSHKSVSHETVLNGPMAQRTSFSIEKKKPPPIPDLKGTALYEFLLTYSMSEEQLKDNGFPMPHPTDSGKAVIEGMYANKSRYCNDQFKRTCSRCQKVYYVNVDGDYVRDEECDFHWGRLWKRKIAGAFESRYNCCQGDAESDGCCVSAGHVFEGSEANTLKGYVKTIPKTPPPDRYYGIYALDCEMCYTTAGMELTRVTVVGPDSKPVYETFVKPLNKVLDYNTRFSGITEENLKSVRTTLRDVQAVLLCIFNSKTILIGHSLESDFKALKLIHATVVDTSVVFPHKMGPPYKRALKTLMGEYLNKIIQNEVGGHDSQEDAVACMELMLWKVKEDLRANR